jgi:ABC-type microcin C transport system duplicated ATPase subunit YejF
MDNFLLSLTIQDPQNKLIARKCVQKIIKKPLSINNLFKESNPKYKLKLSKKSYSEIKK